MKAFKILFLALFALVSTQSAGQQQLFLNQTGGAPPTAGLLDRYKGAAFAAAPDVLLYSTYSATDDIAGSLTNGQVGQWSVAVFRDFDDAIKSFTPAEVAGGTANTWVQELGPSDGFVRRWYDQSVTALDVSNLNHAEQSDPTKMPKLFDSSTGLILENGKAALEFSSDNIVSNLALQAQPNTIFSIATSYAAPSGLNLLYDSGPSGTDRNTFDNRGDAFAGNVVNGTGWAINTQYLHCILYSGSLSTIHRNSVLNAIGNIGGQGISGLTIGSRFNDTFHWSGKIQMIVLYNSNQSTNRPGIETAINNKYSIY